LLRPFERAERLSSFGAGLSGQLRQIAEDIGKPEIDKERQKTCEEHLVQATIPSGS
jgi:hypothetical protein